MRWSDRSDRCGGGVMVESVGAWAGMVIPDHECPADPDAGWSVVGHRTWGR